MKSQFSSTWISSVQPRKQRKYVHNAPLHIKHKFLSANLSKPLRQKYGKRNLPLRKGDEVLVMRGSFKKKKAKVILVNLKRTKVALEGLQRTKREGSKVNVYFHPSVLQIQSLGSDDKERVSLKGSKKEAQKTAEKTVEKQVVNTEKPAEQKSPSEKSKSTKPKGNKNAPNKI